MKPIIQEAKNIIYCNKWLLLFSVIYYIIIVLLSSYLNVWEDELYTINTSSKSLSYALHQSFYFESQPPVYFLLLTIWRFVSDSILWARLFSMFSIILSQILLFWFISKLADRKIAIFSSILFLLNPFIIFTILEMRLFAFLVLLTLISTICFYYTYYSSSLSLRRRTIFIAIAVLGTFTQYYFCFVLVSFAIILLIGKKWKPFLVYILEMLIPVCLLLLVIPEILDAGDLMVSSVPVVQNTFINQVLEALKVLFNRIMVYVLPLDFSTARIWILRIFFFLLLAGTIDLRNLKNSIRILSPFIIITFVLLLFFFFVHLIFGVHYCAYKYTTVLFVPIFILMVFILRSVRNKYLIYWFLLLVMFYTIADYKGNRYLYKAKDFRALSTYIQKIEQTDEPIYIFRNISADNLSLYYNGINKIIPVPEAFSYSKEFSPEQWKIDERYLNELDKKLINCPGFFVVVDNSPLNGVNESKTMLLEFLGKTFTLKEEKSFKGNIILYKSSRIMN
jgi:hypothetical protein